MITLSGIAAQFAELTLAMLLAPLLTGWINMCRAWMQNKSAPPLLTPYRVLLKLFSKEPVLAQNASPLFRITPYIIFGCMCLAAAIIPTFSSTGANAAIPKRFSTFSTDPISATSEIQPTYPNVIRVRSSAILAFSGIA